MSRVDEWTEHVRAAESCSDARERAQPLVNASSRDEASARALVRLVAECRFGYRDSASLLDALVPSAPLGLLIDIGYASPAAVNIDDLNAAPAAREFFARLVERLDEAAQLHPNDAELHAALASAAHRGGRRFDSSAMHAFDRTVALDAGNPNHFYNRGLFSKTRGAFEACVLDNQRALELGMEGDAARWNLGIAASAAGMGELALETFVGLGMKLELSSEGRAEGTFPSCKVRLAERPLAERGAADDTPGREETIWIERTGGAHGIVRSVLVGELGVDYGDVVVFDGAPITRHTIGDRSVPVFPHLMTLERRHYQRYRFAAKQRVPHMDEVVSRYLPGDAVLYSHTENFVLLCNECSKGECQWPDEHGAKTSNHAYVRGALMAAPGLAPAALLDALEAASREASEIAVACPELSEAAGRTNSAEAMNFAQWWEQAG